ncbi:MAG: hypothetical protein ACXAE3_08645 [Candidatus Kariarchaeaceae archaeon]|jgi:hypothetical protein
MKTRTLTLLIVVLFVASSFAAGTSPTTETNPANFTPTAIIPDQGCSGITVQIDGNVFSNAIVPISWTFDADPQVVNVFVRNQDDGSTYLVADQVDGTSTQFVMPNGIGVAEIWVSDTTPDTGSVCGSATSLVLENFEFEFDLTTVGELLTDPTTPTYEGTIDEEMYAIAHSTLQQSMIIETGGVIQGDAYKLSLHLQDDAIETMTVVAVLDITYSNPSLLLDLFTSVQFPYRLEGRTMRFGIAFADTPDEIYYSDKFQFRSQGLTVTSEPDRIVTPFTDVIDFNGVGGVGDGLGIDAVDANGLRTRITSLPYTVEADGSRSFSWTWNASSTHPGLSIDEINGNVTNLFFYDTNSPDQTALVTGPFIVGNDAPLVNFLLPGNYLHDLSTSIPIVFELFDTTADPVDVVVQARGNDGGSIKIIECTVIHFAADFNTFSCPWNDPLRDTSTTTVDELIDLVESISVSVGGDETHTAFPSHKSSGDPVQISPVMAVNSDLIMPVSVSVDPDFVSLSDVNLYFRTRVDENPMGPPGSCKTLPDYIGEYLPILFASHMTCDWDLGETMIRLDLQPHELAHTVQQIVARDQVSGIGDHLRVNPLATGSAGVDNPLFGQDLDTGEMPLFSGSGAVFDIPYHLLSAPLDKPVPITARLLPSSDPSSVEVTLVTDTSRYTLCSGDCVIGDQIFTSFDFLTIEGPADGNVDVSVEVKISPSDDPTTTLLTTLPLRLDDSVLATSDGVYTVMTHKAGIHQFDLQWQSARTQDISVDGNGLGLDTHFRGGSASWVRTGYVYYDSAARDLPTEELSLNFERVSSSYIVDGHVTVLKGMDPGFGVGALDVAFNPAEIPNFDTGTFDTEMISMSLTSSSGEVFREEFGQTHPSHFFAIRGDTVIDLSAVELPRGRMSLDKHRPEVTFIVWRAQLMMNNGSSVVLCEADTCEDADGNFLLEFDINDYVDPTLSYDELNRLVHGVRLSTDLGDGRFVVDSFFDVFYSQCCQDSSFDVFFDITVTDVDDRVMGKLGNHPNMLLPFNLPIDIYIRYEDVPGQEPVQPCDITMDFIIEEGDKIQVLEIGNCESISGGQGLIKGRVVPVVLFERLGLPIDTNITGVTVADTLNRFPPSTFQVDSFFDISYNIQRDIEVFVPDEALISRSLHIPATIPDQDVTLNFEEIKVTYVTVDGIDLSKFVSFAPSETDYPGDFVVVVDIPSILLEITPTGDYREFSPAKEQLKGNPIHVAYGGGGGSGGAIYLDTIAFVSPEIDVDPTPTIYKSTEIKWDHTWFDLQESDKAEIALYNRNGFLRVIAEVPVTDNAVTWVPEFQAPGEYYTKLTLKRDGAEARRFNIDSPDLDLSGEEALDVDTNVESTGSITPDEALEVKWSPVERGETEGDSILYSISIYFENGTLIGKIAEGLEPTGIHTFPSLKEASEQFGVRLTIQGENFGSYYVEVESDNGWVSGISPVFKVDFSGNTEPPRNQTTDTGSDTTDAPTLPVSILPVLLAVLSVPLIARRRYLS